MKSLSSLVLVLFSAVCLAQSNNYAEKEILLKLREIALNPELVIESGLKSETENLEVLGLRKLHPSSDNSPFLIQFSSEHLTVADLIEILKENSLFEYVEPNYISKGHGTQTTPNDFHYTSRQWSHNNIGSYWFSATADADIDTDLAWDITQGDTNTVLAIIDSGTKIDHPEFAGRLWINQFETQSGTDSDNNGYVDDFYGYDFVTFDNGVEDEHGHGTNVAGIALATGDNSIGYAGVNWKAKMMVVRALDEENSGFYSWMAESIYYAVDNGADVINMSIGGDNPSNTLLNAVNYAYANDVPLVVSGGNGNTLLQYPAAYADVIAVGSTDPEDLRSVPFSWSSTSGSNYGNELDFVAPGSIIYGLSYNSNTNYNTNWNGTSQAAPHVAGTISLLLAIDPSLTVDEINTILIQTSEDQVGDASDTPGWDQYYGYGRINAYQALLSILQTVNIDENKQEIEPIIFPNPVTKNGALNLKYVDERFRKISIYSVDGKLKKQEQLNGLNSNSRISLTGLKSGLYLVQFVDDFGSAIRSERLMITEN